MENLVHFRIILLFLASFLLLQNVTSFKNQDTSEEWGYVQVRPSTLSLFFFCSCIVTVCEKVTVNFMVVIIVIIVIAEAHMFWWHYKSPYRVEDPSKPWPIILWLQGGPVSR